MRQKGEVKGRSKYLRLRQWCLWSKCWGKEEGWNKVSCAEDVWNVHISKLEDSTVQEHEHTHAHPLPISNLVLVLHYFGWKSAVAPCFTSPGFLNMVRNSASSWSGVERRGGNAGQCGFYLTAKAFNGSSNHCLEAKSRRPRCRRGYEVAVIFKETVTQIAGWWQVLTYGEWLCLHLKKNEIKCWCDFCCFSLLHFAEVGR